MTVTCPACRRIMAKEDRRRIQPLVPCEGVRIILREKEAPRLKCTCGKLVIVLKGNP